LCCANRLDKKIALVILEAYNRDVGTGVARVGSEVLKSIEASSNDLIELIGHRRTTAKLLQLYPHDEKKGIIRIDGLIRNNVGANIGDHIVIRKITSQRAEKVTVEAIHPIPEIDERYLADALDTIPVSTGDKIMVPYFGGHLTFQVVDTKPNSMVVIDQKTIFVITNPGSPSKMRAGIATMRVVKDFEGYPAKGCEPCHRRGSKERKSGPFISYIEISSIL